MPYVTHEARNRIDRGHCPETVGELTYEMQQLAQRYLLRLDRELHYSDHAEVLAALEGCKADFIDRILMPYEATKCAENGDCWDERLIATNRPFNRPLETRQCARNVPHPSHSYDWSRSAGGSDRVFCRGVS